MNYLRVPLSYLAVEQLDCDDAGRVGILASRFTDFLNWSGWRNWQTR